MMAATIRRYCEIGLDCMTLEVQKLAWFLDRSVQRFQAADPFEFRLRAGKYGPYSHNLQKLLDALDGSYLHCEKRVVGTSSFDLIWSNEDRHDFMRAYLKSGECKEYSPVLEWAMNTIDGFEAPHDMELLATVDWLMQRDHIEPTVKDVMAGIGNWAGGRVAGQRKLGIFDDRLVSIALQRLQQANQKPV